MLRVQGILQLEPLWLRPTTPVALTTTATYQAIVQEPESYVIQNEEPIYEEPEEDEQDGAPEYQEIIEDHEVHTTSVTKIKEEEVVLLVEEEDEDEGHVKSKEGSAAVPAPIKTEHHHQHDDEPTRNDSSLSVSSSTNQPPTPTSTTSQGPFRRLRRDSKFNERRKSVTNKLKRAFSTSTNTSSKRNSIISTQ
ncbi:hypothetical protein BC940DRAFT_343257 [Gongronella butleri]|nr:hypothetical protein BC940DRAFT_343257 [Gongronella butleri]